MGTRVLSKSCRDAKQHLQRGAASRLQNILLWQSCGLLSRVCSSSTCHTHTKKTFMSNPEPADYKIFVFDYHLDYFLVFLVEVLVTHTQNNFYVRPRAFCNEENPSWRILVRGRGASSYETHSALFTPMLLWRCRGDQLMQNIAKQCCKNLNTAVSWLVCRVFLSSLVFEVAQFTFWCSPAALARGGKRKRCFPPFVQTYCKHSPCV